ncbi:MAG: hypothetical protein E7436_02050 [Ruminococcaceae bacterium]|nr:hypothetical protein [Oscillospiraceae bacterium]
MVPEYVIVTLQSENGAFLGDYRLPTGVPIGTLYPLLTQALETQLENGTVAGLSAGGYSLSETQTLADHAIWDGSILTVREVAR